MKKLLYFVAIMAGGLSLASCLDSYGNNASAELDFYARYDKIEFNDSNDVVFTHLIDTALQKLGVLSDPYVFTAILHEKAEVNYSSPDAAVHNCCVQADTKYQAMLSNVTSSKLREQMAAMNAKTGLPLDSLDGFTVHYALLYFEGKSAGFLPVNIYKKNY